MTGCVDCAYAVKENGKPVWCKFHMQEVGETNYCDNFLDVMDSPRTQTMIDRLAEISTGKKRSSLPTENKIKNIIAWILIALIIGFAIYVFLFF